MKLSIVFHCALHLYWKEYLGWHFVRWGIPTEVTDGVPIATSFMVLLFQLSLSGRHNFGLNYTNIPLSLFNIQGISDSFISTALPSRYHGIRNVEIYCLNKFMCAFFFKAAGGL